MLFSPPVAVLPIKKRQATSAVRRSYIEGTGSRVGPSRGLPRNGRRETPLLFNGKVEPQWLRMRHQSHRRVTSEALPQRNGVDLTARDPVSHSRTFPGDEVNANSASFAPIPLALPKSAPFLLQPLLRVGLRRVVGYSTESQNRNRHF